MLRRLLTTFVVAALTLVTLVAPAQASGSKDLLPSGSGETSCDATHRCRPAIEWRTSSYGPAAAGEVRVNRRTLFTVFAKAGERILLGSSSVGRLAGDAVVWAPGQIADGDLTSTSLPAPAYSCVAQRALAGSAATMGQISTRTQELAGARSVDGSANAAGYVPCYYDVTTTGLHRVAFYGTAGASTDVQALPANSQQVATSSGTFPVETTSATASSAVLAWDVTVRSSAAASVTDVPGRAFTYAIAAFTGNNPRAVAWTYYLNTLDGFRYLVDTNGFDPNGFVLYGNRVGFLDSDGVTPLNHDVVGIGANVQSLQQLAGGVHLAAPEYPLSFEPLAAETLGALGIPVVPTKPTLENLSFSGHASGSQTYVKQGGTFSFDVGGPGTYEVVVSADGTDYDPGLGANATVRGVVSGGTFPRTVTVGWDGKANNGTVLPAKLGYPMRATLRAGEYHAPMMDVENSVNGGPSITLLNPPGGVCPFSNVSSTGTNCTRAFYDDRSYVTADGTLVGTAVGGPLCSAHIGPANPVLFANPTTGFDSTGTQRAWGNTNGNNANTYCPTTGTLAALGDGKGLDLWTYFPSEERTASLDILALPTAPTAADDAWSTAHDATLVATGVLANDTGTSLAATKTTDPAHGTATLAADGTLHYTPGSGFSGLDSFTYTATDAAGQTATATVTITVTPAAVDDAGSTTAGVALVVGAGAGLLANDVGSNLSAVVVTPPAHGTIVLGTDGRYTYTPAAGFSGDDEVTYRITDGVSTRTATLTLVVRPTADDESVSTAVGTPVLVDVLTGDLGSGLVVTGTTPPAHGSIAQNPDGTITYTPAPGYSGTDEFTYTVTDTASRTAQATVRIAVLPLAPDDAWSTPAGTALTVTGVLANDAGTSLTATKKTNPAHGTASLDADGTVRYTPATGFSGVDTFTYTATDAAGQEAVATVTITVTPKASDDTGSTRANVALEPVDGVLENDLGTDLEAELVTAPAHGTITLNVDGTYRYTPDADFSGDDELTYRVSDGTSSDTATLRIVVRPTADDDSTSTGAEQAVTIDVLDGDPGTGLEVTSAGPAAHGDVVVDPTGAVTYTPEDGWSGQDTFTYTVTDDSGRTSQGQVTVTVRPRALDDAWTTPYGTTLVVPAAHGVLDNDLGTSLTVVSSTAPVRPAGGAVGTATVGTAGDLELDPPAGFSGPLELTYTVRDADGRTAAATVRVVVGVDADDDTATTTFGTALTVTVGDGVLRNDHGSALTATLETGPSHGDVALALDGSYVFTPDADFSGVDSFEYRASDGTSSVTATVTVHVTPVAADDTYAVPAGTSLAGASVLGNDGGTDLTADPLDADTDHGHVVLTADGTFTYVPDDGFTGTDTFTYTGTDAAGQVITAVATIVVGPRASDDAYTTAANTPLAVGATHAVTGNDTGTDIVLDPLDADTDHGHVVLAADGTFTYVPNDGFTGTDTFAYTGTDHRALPVGATVTVLVGPRAYGDAFTIPAQTTLTVDAAGSVLGNDLGTGLTLDPADVDTDHGHVVVAADGTFVYTPQDGFSGVDTFAYTGTDAGGRPIGTTVTITVTPRAVDDLYGTPANTTLVVGAAQAVVANDLGTGLTVTPLDADTVHGHVVLAADGTFTYVPGKDYTGPDEFTYTGTDADGRPVTAVVHLTVGPRAYDDAASGRPDTPVTLDPTANDLTAGTWDTGSLRLLDPVSGAAVVTVTVAGVGTWTARSDGTVLFDPVDGYAGTASVGYTVEDSTGAAVEARLTVTYPMVATEPSQSPAATPTDGPTPSVSPTPVPVAPTDKPLATTGAEVLPWLLATAVLLAAGGVLVTLRVRRREE